MWEIWRSFVGHLYSCRSTFTCLFSAKAPETLFFLEFEFYVWFVSQVNGGSETKAIVAVRQGNLLATAFHPELTADYRW